MSCYFICLFNVAVSIEEITLCRLPHGTSAKFHVDATFFARNKANEQLSSSLIDTQRDTCTEWSGGTTIHCELDDLEKHHRGLF